MLVTASYIEEVKPGWRDLEDHVLQNILYNFGVNLHFYIGRNSEKNLSWHQNKSKGLVESRYLHTFEDLEKALSLDYYFVNVQPREVFDKANKNWNYLDNFCHPLEDCCYVFGPNHGEIKLIDTVMAHNVAIYTVRSTLYTTSAMAIALADRLK